ncbi:porin family protein [Fibrella aquatilis]|uniref:PorT family protein n=1 Tax=Fibrella aquatilis TaxID=2817059 RepID=A0A939K277_9BACT|nr:porin family protein [Fibrella aquatilis]MBO0934268.1 PorT family protein [Fibrella aquatilis]
MKHIVCSLLLLFVNASLLAQSPNHVQAYMRAGAGGSRAIGDGTSSGGTVYTVLGNNGIMPYELGGSHWLLTGAISAGIIAPVDNHFVIQAELSIEQKGSEKQVTKAGPGEYCDFGCFPSAANGRFSSRLTYLTLPVMIGYRSGKATVLAGPYIGYKLGEKIQGTYTYGQSSASEIPISSSVERYKKIDAGFVAAAAYAISPRFGIDLRYSQGLRHVAEQYKGYTEPFYNQSAQVGVTYALTRN